MEDERLDIVICNMDLKHGGPMYTHFVYGKINYRLNKK
jgi:hypothetical protein